MPTKSLFSEYFWWENRKRQAENQIQGSLNPSVIQYIFRQRGQNLKENQDMKQPSEISITRILWRQLAKWKAKETYRRSKIARCMFGFTRNIINSYWCLLFSKWPKSKEIWDSVNRKRKCSGGLEHFGPPFRKTALFSSANNNFGGSLKVDQSALVRRSIPVTPSCG